MSTTTDTMSPKANHRPRRVPRHRVIAATVALAASAGIGVAGAGAASAAGPSSLPYYGYSADFPTWFWGPTTLCVTNRGSNYGLARVQSRLGTAPEYIGTPAYSTRCIARYWWGVPVTVTNVSFTPLVATSY